MCTDLLFRRITFTNILCLLSFMVKKKTTADFMELISHTNEVVKNLILLLITQYTQLLLLQLGKTDTGFHLLLFIISRKMSSMPICKSQILLTFTGLS